MFRILRLKLMLVNLSVIVLLFFLLITGTYFFVQDRMLDGREHMMNKISQDLVTGRFPDFPPNRGPVPAFNKTIDFPPNHDLTKDKPTDLPPDNGPGPITFFIKISPADDILLTSAFMPLTNSQLSLLVLKIRQSKQDKGNILFDQNEYSYQITPEVDNQNVFIIFQDLQRDRNLLKALVTGLSITGIICMILSVFGSLFMANKAMTPIQKSWQQQKDFLADASHEFRTPLTIIQTNLEIVRDNPEETVRSQEHWLSNIYEETLCMTKLVESLLFLARADSHQQLLNKDHFLLNQTIMIAAELFRPIAAIHGIILDLQVKTPIPYCGDEARLRQVVGILLDNAIRHTPTNGQITVKLDNSQHGILLSITDTGEGINPEHLEKIFERFFQSDSSRSQGGTGLGLPIAKWIVESHNGNISVLSTLGKGTIFNVLLPHL